MGCFYQDLNIILVIICELSYIHYCQYGALTMNDYHCPTILL